MAFQPKRILVATDFSKPSQDAADAAVDLARQLGADIFLFHAINPIPMSTSGIGVVASGLEAPTLEAYLNLKAKAAIDLEATRLTEKGALKVDSGIGHGSPADQVARTAVEGDFDLVVTGTRGRTGISRAVLGSVAEGIVRRSNVPVLTIHPRPQ
jgi:nucleotide-binding universal stress UspA family protein